MLMKQVTQRATTYARNITQLKHTVGEARTTLIQMRSKLINPIKQKSIKT